VVLALFAKIENIEAELGQTYIKETFIKAVLSTKLQNIQIAVR
jgi:hypothetical protein